MPETDNMILCEDCQEWFHWKCVNLSEDEVDAIDRYSCVKCAFQAAEAAAEAEAARLYCVCRKPEGDDGEMIQCETCDEWLVQ